MSEHNAYHRRCAIGSSKHARIKLFTKRYDAAGELF